MPKKLIQIHKKKKNNSLEMEWKIELFPKKKKIIKTEYSNIKRFNKYNFVEF